MPDLGKEALPPMSMCLSHLAPNQAFRPLWSMGRALQLQQAVSAPPLTPSCSTYRCKEALSKQAVSPNLLNQGFSGQTNAVPHKTQHEDGVCLLWAQLSRTPGSGGARALLPQRCRREEDGLT